MPELNNILPIGVDYFSEVKFLTSNVISPAKCILPRRR